MARANILFAALLLCLLTGCARNETTYKTRGNVFGTIVEISIYGESQARAYALSGADPFEHAAALSDLAADLEAAEPTAAYSLRQRAAALRRQTRGAH